jgi:tetratricopeptide (TPR) repeat protein
MKSPVTTRYLNGFAEACLLVAEQGNADGHDRHLNKSQRACKEALKQGKAYGPGLPEAMMLRGRYEWLKGDHSAAEKWWQESRALAEAMDLRFDLGRTLLEMGQRLRNIDLLRQAATIFAETNSRWELAKVDEILVDLNSESNAS